MKKYLIVTCASIVLALFSLYAIYFYDLNTSTDVKLDSDVNIVLITIDTLRADHLSCYGYRRNTSPNIDKIAKEGILYTKALATSSWTSPSMASIMTSLYPISHGVSHGIIRDGKVYKQEILSPDLHTLAETLKSNGYTTFGAVANVHMVEELGFAQGFDYYYCEGFDEASAINDVVFSWEDKIKKSKKFFLWVHYFDPHGSYLARLPWINDYIAELGRLGNTDFSKINMKELRTFIPTFKEKRHFLEQLIALYDSEINYVDYYIGHLIAKLRLDRNSLLIITSDHGEEFLDHDSVGHGRTLYQELIHVPLIIKLPFASKNSVNSVNEELVSIIDILPTILGVLGISPPREIKGVNLIDKKKQLKRQKRDYLFSELSKWHVLSAVLSKNWKYIYNYYTHKEELYNIAKDHREMENLIHQETVIAKELKENLINWVSTSPKGPSIIKKVTPTKEIEEKLEALGYISNGE